MTETKKFENERYLYWEADVYTPYSFRKPKLHEMGYFTDNIESFDNLNDPNLDYVKDKSIKREINEIIELMISLENKIDALNEKQKD